VALVLSSFEPGGTERQMIELIRRLDRNRFRVHVACFRRVGAWLPRVEQAAVEVVEFPVHGFRSPATLLTLLRFAAWLRARRIAVLHTCELYANVFALPGAALARVPVRIGSRRELTPPDKTRGHLLAQRLAYRTAHRIVANSSAAAECLRDEGVAPAKIRVIPNGVDLAAFDSKQPAANRRVVTTVANLRAEKGHEVLLRAAALVGERIPDARFRLVGDGPMRPALEGLARVLEVDRTVEFLGYRDDVPTLLAESDVFAFPSHTEASPNGVIEAMAAGLPVVASATGGITELIDSGRNGVLVPPGNADALAAAIVGLLNDAGRAERLGAEARETIRRRYSFERMVDAFEQLYEQELMRKATPLGAAGAVAGNPKPIA
jgi:glycosyltransferase involved in cell wall biosynthesis